MPDPFTVGTTLAGLGLGVAGAMRKPANYGYSKSDLDNLAAQRSSQIDAFSNELAAFRQRYASSIRSFGNNTFNRFTPQAEANFAGRGLQVTGGAFQSALAKKAAEIQDSENMHLFGLEHGDIGAVDAARGNMFGAQAGFRPSGPSADPTSEALGSLGSGLFSYGMGSLAEERAAKNPVPQRRSVFATRRG